MNVSTYIEHYLWFKFSKTMQLNLDLSIILGLTMVHNLFYERVL